MIIVDLAVYNPYHYVKNYRYSLLIVVILTRMISYVYSADNKTKQSSSSIPTDLQPSQSVNLTITLLYNPIQSKKSPQTIQQYQDSYIVYANNKTSPYFVPVEDNIFDCSNTDNFILNFTQNSTLYGLQISGYTQDIEIEIYSQYQGQSDQSVNPYYVNCTVQQIPCIIQLTNTCPTNYISDIIMITILQMGSAPTSITRFQYNTVCNNQMYEYTYYIQWGIGIVVLLSIVLIVMSAKFQCLYSYSNTVLYINYYMVALYLILVITNYLLIRFNPPNILLVVQYICSILAVILAIFGVMVCFAQLMFFLKIGFMRFGLDKGKLKLRIMDGVGLLLGFFSVWAWWYSHYNWIVSDIIFTLIFLSGVKIIKLGSLKIGIIIFISSLIIDSIFIKTFQQIDNSYTNQNFNFFNNPLFLMVPLIAHIPNRRCSWYFIISMSYPGYFLAYLQRFDKNRSSTVYSKIFISMYTICSFVWFLVSVFVPFALPYDVFTFPLTMVLLILFANRRGQLADLWNGSFYDQQREQYINQKELILRLSLQKQAQYNKSLFGNLKYAENSSSFDTRQKNNSFLSQFSRRIFNRKKTVDGNITENANSPNFQLQTNIPNFVGLNAQSVDPVNNLQKSVYLQKGQKTNNIIKYRNKSEVPVSVFKRKDIKREVELVMDKEQQKKQTQIQEQIEPKQDVIGIQDNLNIKKQ